MGQQKRRYQHRRSKSGGNNTSEVVTNSLYLSSRTRCMDDSHHVNNLMHFGIHNTSSADDVMSNERVTNSIEQILTSDIGSSISIDSAERALAILSGLLCHHTEVSKEILPKTVFKIIQICGICSSTLSLEENSRLRCVAIDAMLGVLTWIDISDIKQLEEKYGLIRSCIDGLFSGLEYLHLKLASNDDANVCFLGIKKSFDILTHLCDIRDISEDICSLFKLGLKIEPIGVSFQSIVISFASGLQDDMFNHKQYTEGTYMACEAGVRFCNAIWDHIHDSSNKQSQMKDTILLMNLYRPLFSTCLRYSHGELTIPDFNSNNQLSKFITGVHIYFHSWIISCAELFFCIVQTLNDGKQLDHPLTIECPISLNTVVSFLPNCLYLNSFDHLRYIMTQIAADSKGLSAPTQINSSLLPHCSLSPIPLIDAEIKGHETLKDLNEIDLARRNEQSLQYIKLQFLINSRIIELLNIVTDISILTEQDDFDEPDLPVLLDSICHHISSINQPFVILSHNAIKEVFYLNDIATICGSFGCWIIFEHVGYLLQRLFHCISQIIIARNIPMTCPLLFEQNDALAGPLAAILNIIQLFKQLQQTAPEHIRIICLEILEGTIQMASSIYRQIRINNIDSQLITTVEKLYNILFTFSCFQSNKLKSEEHHHTVLENGCTDNSLAITGKDYHSGSDHVTSLARNIHFQICALIETIAKAPTVDKEPLLKIIVKKNLEALEMDLPLESVILAAILDKLFFNLFDDETYDRLFIEYQVVPRLQVFNKKFKAILTLTKTSTLEDWERYTVQAATKNLPAFIKYKQQHITT